MLTKVSDGPIPLFFKSIRYECDTFYRYLAFFFYDIYIYTGIVTSSCENFLWGFLYLHSKKSAQATNEPPRARKLQGGNASFEHNATADT